MPCHLAFKASLARIAEAVQPSLSDSDNSPLPDFGEGAQQEPNLYHMFRYCLLKAGLNSNEWSQHVGPKPANLNLGGANL